MQSASLYIAADERRDVRHRRTICPAGWSRGAGGTVQRHAEHAHEAMHHMCKTRGLDLRYGGTFSKFRYPMLEIVYWMLSIALTNTGINTQGEMEEEGAMYSLSVLVFLMLQW